jgi:hypothetical protein
VSGFGTVKNTTVVQYSNDIGYEQPCSDHCHHHICDDIFTSCVTAGNSRGYCNNQTMGFYASQTDYDSRQNRIGGLPQCRGCGSKVQCHWMCKKENCMYMNSPEETVDRCSGCNIAQDAELKCHPD